MCCNPYAGTSTMDTNPHSNPSPVGASMDAVGVDVAAANNPHSNPPPGRGQRFSGSIFECAHGGGINPTLNPTL